jgi:hypothetical protein
MDSEVVVNKQTFDTTIKIDFHGYMWIYLGWYANLSCGRRQALGDWIVEAVDKAEVRLTPVQESMTISQLGDPFKFYISSDRPTIVSIVIFNLTGRIVRTVERECTEGPNELTIDGSSLPPGPYWYVARAGEWMRSGKLIKLAE